MWPHSSPGPAAFPRRGHLGSQSQPVAKSFFLRWEPSCPKSSLWSSGEGWCPVMVVLGRGSPILSGREQHWEGSLPQYPRPCTACLADPAHSDGGVDATAQALGPAAHLRLPDGLTQRG